MGPLQVFWWMLRDSNPVAEATDLQSAAVTNAAQHPINFLLEQFCKYALAVQCVQRHAKV
jgi:hypothetical protein